MRITDKVRIGGIDYSIKFVPNLRDDEKLLYGHIFMIHQKFICPIRTLKSINADV